jgi:hypothetical protein
LQENKKKTSKKPESMITNSEMKPETLSNGTRIFGDGPEGVERLPAIEGKYNDSMQRVFGWKHY